MNWNEWRLLMGTNEESNESFAIWPDEIWNVTCAMWNVQKKGNVKCEIWNLKIAYLKQIEQWWE